MRTLLSLVLLSLLSCGRPDEGSNVDSSTAREALSWSEFVAQAYVEPDTGEYVVNGDELAEDLAALAEAYRNYRSDLSALNSGMGVQRQELIVNRVNNQDDRWNSSTALNLTYCISQRDFGSRYAAVVSAMDSAASAWEGVARVNFVHASQLDGNCTSRTGVVFDVRSVCRGQYLARAFFPSSSRRSREVLIDCSSFGNIAPWTLAGVLRHELGHTIGFRHEHTRPESGVCFEDSRWRALTAYDSASVMHYPQCNGTQNGDLVLTNLDRQGAALLYP